MKKSRILVCILALVLAVSSTACGNKTKKYDNEKDALVFSTLDLEGVFSPFYSTAATDTNMVSNTQISMLSADKDGKVAYGADHPVVTLDYSNRMFDAQGNASEKGDENGTTIYQFVIKNGIKYSDGQPLTIKDVLFNLYFYIDPVYTGSSTIYSTKIQGLDSYRSVGMSTDGDSSLDTTAASRAATRMENLSHYATDGSYPFTDEELDTIKLDIAELKGYLKDELRNDWATAKESLETYVKEYDLTESWQLYLFIEGIATIKTNPTTGKPVKNDKGLYVIDYKGFDSTLKDKSETGCIEAVYKYYTDSGIEEQGDMTQFATVLSRFNAGNKLHSSLIAKEKSAIIDEMKEAGLALTNVSGIKAVKGSAFKGGKTYDDSYDVLQITIDGVDPKAIWNFGFTVAPMHYYSGVYEGVDYVDKFDGKNNFGFPMGDVDFFTDVIQAKNKLPMGAGVYQASTANGIDVSKSELEKGFFKDFFVYFERNPYFYTCLKKGAQSEDEAKAAYNAKIRRVKYKVVDSKNVINSLRSGDILCADPPATENNMNTLNSIGSITYSKTLTSGYGYIGINSKYVNNINIRRAIMSVLDANLVQAYYPGDLSTLLTRPMTKASWVYKNASGPDWDPKPVYDFDSSKYKQNGDTYPMPDDYKEYMRSSGAFKNSDGKWMIPTNTGNKALKYTFTVAGASDDHPAYMTLETAMKYLNADGWDISLKTNSRALSALATGGLTVWAAAWSSTIDPDMYQVYHVKSQATSTLSWGYDWIKANSAGDAKESYDIVMQLSDLIDAGRQTLDVSERTQIYREALDMVMDLAVEFPLYQRVDLFVFNKDIIDGETLIPENECTSYCSPINRIWEVSFKK